MANGVILGQYELLGDTLNMNLKAQYALMQDIFDPIRSKAIAVSQLKCERKIKTRLMLTHEV